MIEFTPMRALILATTIFGLSPVTLWILAGIILAIAEMLTPGFVLLAFSGGCFLAALFSVFAGIKIQLIAFCIGSLACFFSFRKLFHGQDNKEPETSFGTEALQGKTGKVLETVSDDSGYVQVGGERWQARIQSLEGEIATGVDIKVVAIDGNKLMVEPV